MRRNRIVCMMLLALCVRVGAGVEPQATDTTGVAAVSVGDFLDSLGVCTHIGQGIAPPGKLGYTIPDQPATVHDLLLRKSNGTFELVVWSEKAEGTNRVTVDLGDAHPSVKVYDPTTGTAPTQTLTEACSVPLTLSDHPVIIEI